MFKGGWQFRVFILALVVLLGTAIRFYKLGKIPTGFYLDEAAQGYSAYSILKTGKDEFGKPFPIIFRSFTDFKTPVYIYLIVPLIPIFGLSAFTVRFPSFLFSVLTFPLIYLLITKVTSKRYSWGLAVVSTFLLAISPWHALFGRTNFECNVALFFLLAGIYLFYLGLARPWIMVGSALIFGISLHAYHTERVLAPLTVLFLGWRYRRVLLEKTFRLPVLVAFFAGLVVAWPLLAVATTPGFLSRATNLNIFDQAGKEPTGYLANVSGWESLVVNNRVFLVFREFLSLYLSYFSPRNMFDLGDYGLRSSFPSLATFYSWQLPFYLAGLYFLVRKKDIGELRSLTIFLLLASPIPAAMTRDPYTTIRALPLVVPQLVAVGLGILLVYRWLGKELRIAYLLVLGVICVYSVLDLYSSAFILNEYYRAAEWNYGFDQVAQLIKSADSTLPVVVDNARGENYIELLFFLKFDPAKYQGDNFEVSLVQYYTNLKRNPIKKIGRITVRPIAWAKDLLVDQILVGDELAISKQQIEENKLTLVGEVLYPDRKVAFRIVRTNPEYQLEKRRGYLLTK